MVDPRCQPPRLGAKPDRLASRDNLRPTVPSSVPPQESTIRPEFPRCTRRQRSARGFHGTARAEFNRAFNTLRADSRIDRSARESGRAETPIFWPFPRVQWVAGACTTQSNVCTTSHAACTTVATARTAFRASSVSSTPPALPNPDRRAARRAAASSLAGQRARWAPVSQQRPRSGAPRPAGLRPIRRTSAPTGARRRCLRTTARKILPALP